MANTYDVGNDAGKVRLLLSDIEAPWVFSDEEITALLDLEGGSVKRTAAQAIDTNATNQALASKVLKDHERTTDGAKLADAMRKHADRLRQQADGADDKSDAGFYFGVVDIGGSGCRPELTEHPHGY